MLQNLSQSRFKFDPRVTHITTSYHFLRFDFFALFPQAVLFNTFFGDDAADSVLFAVDEGAYEFAAIFVVDLAVAVLFVEGEHGMVALIRGDIMTITRRITLLKISIILIAINPGQTPQPSLQIIFILPFINRPVIPHHLALPVLFTLDVLAIKQRIAAHALLHAVSLLQIVDPLTFILDTVERVVDEGADA